MEKNLKDDFIELNIDNLKNELTGLSITSLINCLEESNKKEEFKKEVSTSSYEKIVKYSNNWSLLIIRCRCWQTLTWKRQHRFHCWLLVMWRCNGSFDRRRRLLRDAVTDRRRR